MSEPGGNAGTNAGANAGRNAAFLADLAQWQRLSPIALVYFCLQLFKSILGNLSYLIPAIIVFYRGIQKYPGYFALGLGLLLLFLAVVGMLRYLAFRFRVTQDTVEIHSGVLRKKQLNLPFNRIQNVRLLQPLYYRPTDHLSVILDTAGSSQQEAQLAALPKQQAEALQQAIYQAKQQQSSTAEHAAEHSLQQAEVPAEQLLCSRSVKDLILYGISNNRVLLLLGLAAPFYKAITDIVTEQLQRFGLDLSHWFDATQQSWLWIALAVLALAMLFMLLITLLSIAVSVMSYYQFRLWRSTDRYIRRSGLLTRHEISMKSSRLQWLHLQQDWLDKVFGRVNVRYEQLFSPIAAAQGEAGQGNIMVPALLPAQASGLLDEVYPDNQLATMTFRPVNWRYLMAGLILFCVPFLALSGYFYSTEQPVLAGLSTAGLLLSGGLQFMRWRRLGYAMDAEYFYLRRGIIGIDYFCVPLHKLQQLELQQHWFMQRAGLRHLTLVYAAGSLTVHYMPAAEAEVMANYALYQAQSSGRGWM
ncbi:PH domain-containing protein [Arsukibacterium sp.]|uniref:PH domain-containing protein n=1 Tax=Arsukibacterium sp. TaxID=1977258 RepID=UPI002FD989EB